MAFLHGVEVIEIDAGRRPIEGVSASVIGLLGVALKGPVKVPTLIASRTAGEEAFGKTGTIGPAIAAIFEQASAQVVVVNALDPSVDKSSQAEKTFDLAGDSVQLDHKFLVASSVVVQEADGDPTFVLGTDYTLDAEAGVITRVDGGGIDANETIKIAYDYADAGQVTDAEVVAAAAKFVEAESVTGQKPRILIAPGYTEHVTRANPNGPPTDGAGHHRPRRHRRADPRGHRRRRPEHHPGRRHRLPQAALKPPRLRRRSRCPPHRRRRRRLRCPRLGPHRGPDRPQRPRARLLELAVEPPGPRDLGDGPRRRLHPR